jgi:hypothetical protein
MSTKPNYVFVLDTNHKPLTPCKPSLARKLLKVGKAKVFRLYPFTIILKKEVTEDPRPMTLKIDPGSKVSGLAILSSSDLIWVAELTHRPQAIKASLDSRRSLRRGRRNRHTPYRVRTHLVHTTRGGRTFSEVFRFNQRVAMNLTNQVVKYYNRETVALPADVGVFVTPETALSKQKPFESSSLANTDSQQLKAVDRETRQRDLAILEKLPEAVLDEAVKFLESLYVKGDPVE